MKLQPNQYAKLASCALAGLIAAGCAQQQRGYHSTTTANVGAPTAGASSATFEENGIKWIRSTMAFPTGVRETSGLLVEKTVPAEVLAGQNFDYAYKVSNLTEHPIHMVMLADRISPNFAAGQAEPPASDIKDGVATWQLGSLGPKETKVVHVKGSSAEEGAVNTCGWASYSPVLCGDIRVVKANLQLTRTAPADAIICDPIPMTLTVKNSGSSTLTGVKVTDPLPDGLTSEGKNNLTFDAGTMGPGETREFKFNVMASKTGQYANKSEATTAQGVSAQASTATVVQEPILSVSCAAPEQRYMGRPFDVGFTVVNKGDAVAAGSVLELPIPQGLTFRGASANGQASGDKVTWDLGSLPPNGSQQVSVTFVGANDATHQFAPAAKGTCAKMVAAACQTRVMGMAGILMEKADDPDPIGVNEQTVYTVKVTNQGTADDTNVKVVVTIAPEMTPVSATGDGSISGQAVTFPVIPRLAPKEAVSYKITVKGVKPGDGHTMFQLTSDTIKGAVLAEESTHVY
jgi:uncharacterized repeat protein (TIGR01451 family)